jgi:hypothetical protein|tara:strand:- start:59 stop:613 length:555 start_codon:yes stop_codon:yes gene_type:complete
MRIDLFAVPIHVGKVDLNQIQLTSDMGKKWVSETPTSFEKKNFLDKESEKYLIKCIGKLIKDDYYSKFQLGILDIWQNNYKNNDYQEPHVHANSKLCFIIYKKVTTPKTIFFNPAKNVIDMLEADDLFPRTFLPNKLKTGSIIVFPGFLEHMVVPNSDQTTISGNLIFKPINKGEEKNAIRNSN